MRTLIASLGCAAVLLVAAVPAGASPVGGRPQAPTEQPTTQPPVIHELHTVVRERDAGRTLAFVLAGAALFVASGTAAYLVISVRRTRLSTQA